MAFDPDDFKTFKAELFDTIELYCEELEDAGHTIPDRLLLREISLMAIDEKKSPYSIIKRIKSYVDTTGYDAVSPFVKNLYQQTSSLKTNIKAQLDALNYNDPVVKDAYIQLLMYNFSKTQPNYHGYLIAYDRVLTEFNFVQQSTRHPAVSALHTVINQSIDEDDPSENRLQMIVRQNDHYIPIDINKQKKSCFIIDAAGDLRQNNLHDLVNNSPHIDRVYYVHTENYSTSIGVEKIGRIQYDEWNCSTFALDHSLQVANNPVIHEWLECNATQDEENVCLYFVVWSDLGPEMVRNAQSPSFREYYVEKHPESEEVMSESLSKTKIQFKSIASILVDAESDEFISQHIMTPLFRPKLIQRTNGDDEDYDIVQNLILRS